MRQGLCGLFLALAGSAALAHPHASHGEGRTIDPWPAVFDLAADNGCRISEEQLVDVLRAEGVASPSDRAAMVKNFGAAQGVRHDQGAGAFILSGIGKC